MSERLKAMVVDSEAARGLVALLMELSVVKPEDIDIPKDILDILELANEIIRVYVTDPPALEDLLDEYIVTNGLAFEDLIEQVGLLLDNATQHIYYDITEVKHVYIGDETGMVMLMI